MCFDAAEAGLSSSEQFCQTNKERILRLQVASRRQNLDQLVQDEVVFEAGLFHKLQHQ